MIYILLGAGSGTRMGALTSDRAKIMVDIAGRPILAHNLDHIQAVDGGAEILVISGYAASTVDAVVHGGPWTGVRTVRNPDFATAGPLRSIEVALNQLAGTAGAITIGNGDTIFEPAALRALAGVDRPAALLASMPTEPDADDVQLRIETGRIAQAAKRIDAAGTVPISAGLLQLRGAEAIAVFGRAVRVGLAEERRSGTLRTWHSALADLGALAPEPVFVPRESWSEFDSQANVARYAATREDRRAS